MIYKCLVLTGYGWVIIIMDGTWQVIKITDHADARSSHPSKQKHFYNICTIWDQRRNPTTTLYYITRDHIPSNLVYYYDVALGRRPCSRSRCGCLRNAGLWMPPPPPWRRAIDFNRIYPDNYGGLSLLARGRKTQSEAESVRGACCFNYPLQDKTSQIILSCRRRGALSVN